MIASIETLCGSWADTMDEFIAVADLNSSSLAALLGVSEGTVRAWRSRQSSPSWNWICQNWYRFPAPLREMLIRPLVASEFVLTPAGQIVPATDCLTDLAFDAQSEVVSATKRIVEHDRDKQWNFDEVAATGRDVAGLVRRFTSIHVAAANRLASATRRHFGWRRA